ncbi:hypothetical protein ABT324_28120 [Saccharopolyspora sp. NPDC000359]|uniref:hypothetical protein n=1 Tax=Saccharopolyspora sp. NPDC000359 TaxID=3154251 RepID=UPI0033288323
MSDYDDLAPDVQAARFGAAMAARGFTPDDVAALVRNAQPALEEAIRAVADGADPSTLRFLIR